MGLIVVLVFVVLVIFIVWFFVKVVGVIWDVIISVE